MVVLEVDGLLESCFLACCWETPVLIQPAAEGKVQPAHRIPPVFLYSAVLIPQSYLIDIMEQNSEDHACS